MKESNSKAIRLWDVSPEAFLVMLRFMYGGDLELKDSTEMVSVLIPLLFLVDQFGVNYLHNECCKNIIQCLSEVIQALNAESLLFCFITKFCFNLYVGKVLCSPSRDLSEQLLSLFSVQMSISKCCSSVLLIDLELSNI